MSTINPYDIVPKYYQLAKILRQKIEEGEWPPRTPIPSERQIEIQYNVSRTTIRQAIDLLEREGLIYREHGKGTFVSPQKLQKPMLDLTSFTEDMLRRGLRPGQVIRRVEQVVPPTSVQHRLELPDGKKVYCIDRIRLGDDEPIGLQTSFLALAENQSIDRRDIEERGSIYRMLQEKFNIIPTEADESLEVTLATPEEAGLLKIKPGAPLLLSERLTYNQYRQPIEFVKILYRGDRYRYILRLTK